MNLFFTTFEAVIALIGIGLLGFWIIARKILPANIMTVLPPLVIDITIPCLIFYNITRLFTPENNPNWWMLPLWWMGFTITVFLLTRTFMFMSPERYRRELGISLFYQNGLFIPLAIISGMYGAESPMLVDLFLFTIFYPAFFFNTYHLFFKNNISDETRKTNRSRIVNSVLVATSLAVFLKLINMSIYIPNFFLSITSMLGKISIPLIFIIIGGTIYIDFQKKGRIEYLGMLQFVLLKNFVMPLIILGLLMVIRPDYNIALIIMLQGAVPPISAVPIVTERAGGNRQVVNQFLIASFLVSTLSIPFMIWLFGKYFAA